MKKTIKLTAIILSLIIAFSSIPLINAAEDGTKVLWSNSFETPEEQGKWTFEDRDNDKENWEIKSNEKDGLAAYDGDKSLYSGSFGVDILDNIAISNTVNFNISSARNIKFTWHVGTTDSYFDLEHYCLYIFKGDCEDSFIEEAVSSDEEYIFDNGKIVGRRIKSETLDLNTTHYQDRSYDMDDLLSEFSDGDDKSIRIAFRHHDGQNQSAIKIDALKIEASYDFDEEYSYNFNGDAQGWTAIDGNGDNYNWERRTIDGEACFISESFAGGKEIEPLNYLVSPLITVESNMFVPRLEWDIGAADQTFCKENYSVYIYEGTDTLNADNIKSKLTDAVHTETLQDDDYVHRTLFLADSYSGKTIRIIFVHHDCEGQYYIKLDNVSLSAVKKAEYTATFMVDGKTYGDPVKGTAGTEIAAPTAPAKDGYTFVGWALEGTTDILTFPQTMGSANVTYVAIFEEVAKFTATFKADGEVYGDVLSYATGEAIVAPAKSPIKDGYVFKGWKGYTPGMKMGTTNVEFVAEWDVATVQYSLEIHEMGTDGEYPEIPAKTVIFKDGVAGETRTIDYTAPEGFEFSTDKKSELEGKIAANGSTVFKVYLDRKSYELKVTVDGKTTPSTVLYGAPISVEDPSKEGHTFTGWDKTIPTAMPAEDVTITATWSVNNYTVTWVVPGQEDQVDTVAYGAGITAPVPTKTGYEFAGWDNEIPATMPAEDLTFTGAWNPATDTKYTVNIHTMNTAGTYDVATDVLEGTTEETVKAVHTVEEGFELGANSVTEGEVKADGTLVLDVYLNRKTITISFNSDGGTDVETLSGLYGAAVGTPATTTKTGYEFAGWSPEVPATFPAADVELTAQWTANKVAVYYMDGNNEILPLTEADFGSKVNAPVAPTKEGYNFVKWTYADGSDVTWPITMGEDAVYVYANWSSNSCSITFKDGETIVETGNQTCGNAIVAPTAPEKTGYAFIGWFDADGNPMPETVPATDAAYYTKYEAITYTATFDADGGTFADGVNNVYEGIYGSTIVAPTAPTKEGYKFADWVWTNSEGETIEAPVTMPAYNVTATATWTEAEPESNSVNTVMAFSISEINEESQIKGKKAVFSANGGKWEAGVADDKDVYPTETAVYYAPGIPAKAGYAISGWKIDDSASDVIAITAQWAVNQYTITFDTVGGNEIAPITQDYNTAVTAPANPVKTGYTFAGWDKTIPTAMPAENVTITAQWTVNQYTITFNTDGGNEIAPITQDYNTAVTAPANPAKTGYTFVGWDKTIPATMPAENVTITAKWTINQYTITFNTDGGNKISPVTQNYNTAVTAPANPTKTGYTFAGWDKGIPATMPAENVTITAKWTINSYDITFNAGEGTFADGSKEKTIKVDYNVTPVAPETPVKVGYGFTGWTPELAPVTGDATYTAQFAAGVVNYTVETYTMDIEGNYGDPATETKSGTADTTATVTPAAKTGFTVDADASVLEGKIAADGSLVLKVYYERNQYTFSTVVDGKTTSSMYYFEEVVTKPENPSKKGYLFTGWTPALPTTMPANDVTVTAEFQMIPSVSIKNNKGSRTINYGETLRLTAEVSDMPSGAKIVWYVDGIKKGEGETFNVSFESGTKTVAVKIVDSNGNVFKDAKGNEVSDSEDVTVNGGFFQKIIAFFKKLFGMNMTVVQITLKDILK